jgi:hypothetical protein
MLSSASIRRTILMTSSWSGPDVCRCSCKSMVKYCPSEVVTAARQVGWRWFRKNTPRPERGGANRRADYLRIKRPCGKTFFLAPYEVGNAEPSQKKKFRPRDCISFTDRL